MADEKYAGEVWAIFIRTQRETPIIFVLHGNTSQLRFPFFVLEKIFPRKLNVTQYFGEQTGADVLARMDWDDRRPAVRMFQEEMTTPLPVNDKTEFHQYSDNFLSLQSGEPGHTAIL